MSKTAFTPGPWRLIERTGEWRPAVQRGTEGGFIIRGVSPEREDADARLIAAAPALYEALKWYAEKVQLCPLTHFGGDAARSALHADAGERAFAALALVERAEDEQHG